LIAQSQNQAIFEKMGVTIHPAPQWRSRRERFLGRARVAQMAKNLAPDLFHVHEPDLLGPIIAAAGSRPVIWDVHEAYLDVLDESYWISAPLRPVARLVWNLLEQRLVKQCAAVVVVTERIASRYQRVHPRVKVVANYPSLAGIDALPLEPRDGKTCVFAGGIDPDRGLWQVLQALALLNRKGLTIPLVLAGPPLSETYLRELLGEADRLGIGQQVQYEGVLTKVEATLLQNRASIGLVPYLPSTNTKVGMANKLFECMSVGLPLVFSHFPNYCEVAGICGAGLPVDPTQPRQIAEALECLVRNPELAKQMGEAGRRAVRERFNWASECTKLLALYQEVLDFKSPPPKRLLSPARASFKSSTR
jgi:glycosyltransferase involved in cell wall biosynthesis